MADRKAGCMSHRRQLWRKEMKKRRCKPGTLRETRWQGCEGEQGEEEITGQEKLPTDFWCSGERLKALLPCLTQPCTSVVWGMTLLAAGVSLVTLQIGSGNWVSKKLLDFLFSRVVISVLYPLIFSFALWTVSPSDRWSECLAGAALVPALT